MPGPPGQGQSISEIASQLSGHPQFQIEGYQLPLPEQIRLVGTGGNPSFQGGMGNYGGSFQGVGFYKDSFYRVFLCGIFGNGSVSSIPTPVTVFTLPAQYIPPVDLFFQTPSANPPGSLAGVACIQISSSNGNVDCLLASYGIFNSLDGISFRVP